MAKSEEKNELIIIVKNKEGEIFIEPSGKAIGRGAYICKDGSCASEAEKKKALERSFSAPVKKELFSELAALNKND